MGKSKDLQKGNKGEARQIDRFAPDVRRPYLRGRRRELAYHNLRMAYMSLTKNTILVRSRLLYVYHRRPSAPSCRGLVALNARRYYLPSRPAARFSRDVKGERTKKEDVDTAVQTARGANVKLGRRKFDSTASHEKTSSVINILSLKFKSRKDSKCQVEEFHNRDTYILPFREAIFEKLSSSRTDFFLFLEFEFNPDIQRMNVLQI